MAFVLKQYQERCREELKQYLRKTRELRDADTAFYQQTRRNFRPVKSFPGLPYVCLRVPTGGGKTILAAHSIPIACRELLSMERCVVLWLAPTTQIVEQTLAGLRDKRHPYRQALDQAFDGCVTVMDLAGALAIQRSTLEVDTVVIVSTLAAMRVENTEGRKIYDPNGYLQACFTSLNDGQIAELEKPTEGFDGKAPSLVNVLRIRRPLVIVDEAHNVRTHLSFETLARFNPSCILEFTATPDQDAKGDPSNVLTQVSAAELKAEQMIKLPIRLKSRPQWKEAIAEAIDKQKELERLAADEQASGGEYIRPIVLLQAQRQSDEANTVTFAILKQSLMDDFNVPEDQIAISTGTKNELEGRNILAADCPVRFIITVDKLREGWDCPFAYILCSVSNLSSKTAVEQILGRILRMPYARSRKTEALNQAYAFITSQGFIEAANALTEALVDSGFERFEAKTLVKVDQGQQDFGPLFNVSVVEAVTEKPELIKLPDDLKERLTVRSTAAGVELVYQGPPLTERDTAKIQAVFAKPEDRQAVDRLARKSRGEDTDPASRGEKFGIPWLAVKTKQLPVFEDQFRESAWSLAACDPALSESEFAVHTGPSKAADVDVTKEGKIEYHFVEELERQLSFLDLRGPQTATELAVWLDRQIPHPDITPAESGLFLRRMVESLTTTRGIPLENLVKNRFRLRDAAESKINAHRTTAEKTAYQQMLLPDADPPLVADPRSCFVFPMNLYPAPALYQGPIRFRKHYYAQPADMNDEESQCAAIIDNLPEVKYWVRNLERRPDFAFWLQTPTDKFYPDFVAALHDGRYLAVEYKGADRLSNDDTKEKKLLGELWQERSGGSCVFRLVTKANMEAEIKAAI